MDHWTFSIDKKHTGMLREHETKDSNNQLIPVGVAIEIMVPGAIKSEKKQQERERQEKENWSINS